MAWKTGLVAAITVVSLGLSGQAGAVVAVTDGLDALSASNAGQGAAFASPNAQHGGKSGPFLPNGAFANSPIILPVGAAASQPSTVNPVIGNILASVAAVPEPGTWTLMIAGFGIAGILTRRRRGGIVSFS